VTPVEEHGWLSVSGGKLLNEHGAPVILRGMSLFWSQWGGKFFTAPWVGKLATDWNCSVVRAPLGVEPNGYLEDPAKELAKIYAVIDASIERGIYVIVDWHSHVPHTNAAVEFFETIMQRYAPCPNIILELWNEPLPGINWKRDILPHHIEVLDRVRKRHISNVAICGTGNYCRDLTTIRADPVPFENVCYALHYYAASHRQGLRRYAHEALRSDICLFVSEYGLSDSSGDGPLDIAEAKRWWDFLDEHHVSHVNWCFNDKLEACSSLRSLRIVNNKVFHYATRSGRFVRRHIRGDKQ
jgi:endoglucanase